jgi:arylsulfatase A-like enzyme
MPTLLGLCGIEVPASVEGTDFTDMLKGAGKVDVQAAIIECIHPFAEYEKKKGGRECRGIRTERYTYIIDLNGPWLLYDNVKDPYQLENLCNLKDFEMLQNEMHCHLKKMLHERHDQFLNSMEYISKWGYTLNEHDTVPYTD